MLITPEPPTISQNIASQQDIVVSPPINRLLRFPSPVLNQWIKLVLQTPSSSQLTTNWLKLEEPHFPTITHGQRTTGNLLTLMLITPELLMISQNTASPPDIAVSPQINKLLKFPLLAHNQLTKLVPQTLSSSQPTTSWSKLKVLHFPTITHGPRTTGSLLTLMPITQEPQMISQNIASPLDIAESLPINKLLRFPSPVHNQWTKSVPQTPSSSQPTTSWSKLKVPHFPTTTHGPRTTGNPLTLMPITPEPQMISQNIASQLDIAVSPQISKLLRFPLPVHNQWTRLVPQTPSFSQLTTNWSKLTIHCTFHTTIKEPQVHQLISSIAQPLTRDILFKTVLPELSHTQTPDSTAKLIGDCEKNDLSLKNEWTGILIDKNNTLYLIFKK